MGLNKKQREVGESDCGGGKGGGTSVTRMRISRISSDEVVMQWSVSTLTGTVLPWSFIQDIGEALVVFATTKFYVKYYGFCSLPEPSGTDWKSIFLISQQCDPLLLPAALCFISLLGLQEASPACQSVGEIDQVRTVKTAPLSVWMPKPATTVSRNRCHKV